MALQPPKVFISYSHDSSEHKQRVHALAEKLRADGIDAWIDQYAPDPKEGWPKWMKTQVEQADRILLVFTETYQRRFDGDEKEGGLGSTFEGVIVTQSLYDSGGRNAKFRAVLVREDDARFIPTEIRRFTWYAADTPEAYEKLLRWLYDSPEIVPGSLGPRPDLPARATPQLFQSKELESRQIHTARSDVGTQTPKPHGQKYRAIFLGTFGGYQTIATGINDLDQVVGYSQLPGGAIQHAFLYQQEELIDLNSNTSETGRACGINNRGQVVGHTTCAFIYQDGRITKLGALSGCTGASLGIGINYLGEIVGASSISNGDYIPFLYRHGSMKQLGSILGPLSQALAINDSLVSPSANIAHFSSRMTA
jgi:probable HAF family extracellular repeat protein